MRLTFLIKGEANLQFILFMLKQFCPNVTVPSISKVKKVLLPGYLPPERVSTVHFVEYKITIIVSNYRYCQQIIFLFI